MSLDLELLNTIKKAEVSPFLLTRIQEKIDSRNAQNYSSSKSIALLIGVFAFAMFNLIVATKNDRPQPKSWAEGMSILPQNSFYND